MIPLLFFLAVPEIHPGTEIVVNLVGGEQYIGLLSSVDSSQISIICPELDQPIRRELIKEIQIDGLPYSIDVLEQGLIAWSQEVNELPTPHPAFVGSMSILWAGAGPLALGDTRSFVAYSVVETVFIGSIIIMAKQGQYGQMALVAGIDSILHFYAIGDSIVEARKRRNRRDWQLSIAPPVHNSPFVVGIGFNNTSWNTSSDYWPGILD